MSEAVRLAERVGGGYVVVLLEAVAVSDITLIPIENTATTTAIATGCNAGAVSGVPAAAATATATATADDDDDVDDNKAVNLMLNAKAENIFHCGMGVRAVWNDNNYNRNSNNNSNNSGVRCCDLCGADEAEGVIETVGKRKYNVNKRKCIRHNRNRNRNGKRRKRNITALSPTATTTATTTTTATATATATTTCASDVADGTDSVTAVAFANDQLLQHILKVITHSLLIVFVISVVCVVFHFGMTTRAITKTK